MRGSIVLGFAIVLAARSATARAPSEAQVAAAERAVVDAIAAKDAAAFVKVVPAPFQVRGLWFDDARCEADFGGGKHEVTATSLPKLLACLAPLNVRGLGSRIAVTLTYDPGVAMQILIMVRGDGTSMVRGVVGVPIRAAGLAGAAPISAKALEANRTRGAAIVAPEGAAKDELAASPTRDVVAWTTVCVDARGQVAKVSIDDAPPAYGKQAAAAIAAWTFTPFRAHGKAVAVCASLPVGYPDVKLAMPPPPPPPPPPRR